MVANHDILLIGLGNEAVTDDGLGIKLVKFFEHNSKFKNLKYMYSAAAGFELVELIHGFKQIVIIDAVQSQSSLPGVIKYYHDINLFRSNHLNNPHEISFSEVLEVGIATGLKMPEKITLITVEIFDNLTLSLNLSERLDQMIPNLITRIYLFLEGIGASIKNSSDCYSYNNI